MNLENYAKACTEAFAEDIDSKGMIELNDYERFVTKLQLTDTAYDIELKVGRHLNTVEGDGFYEVFYNNEIADSLYLYGSFILKKKDMVTINIKSGKGSVMASILALFGKNGALTEEYTIGWSH
ncbi:MAG: hypothetical protein MJ131_02675 [Lachnospiraceae bacterium]|nr:hypothetical protein [Lachnospiraceae bacterium]